MSNTNDGADDPKTPTNETKPLPSPSKDTPSHPRAVHSSGYRGATLQEKRLALLHDLGYVIPEVDIDAFLKTFVPPLKEGINIQDIVTRLKNGQHVRLDRWAQFGVDPSKVDQHEDDVFKGLETVFDKVVEIANEVAPGLGQTVQLRLMPRDVPKDERSNMTRPDAFFILKEAEDSVVVAGHKNACRWYDIAGTGELKKKNNSDNRDDDVTKMVYSMQHTMTIDPCRRCTFGFTIEDTSMRLWFCSRGTMAVSTPFNFIEGYERLTQIFLSFAFATKTELGWDPSIERFDDKGKTCYRIKVGGNVYNALEVLSDFGADAIVGRAARIFKVKYNGKECVLKDIWVEDDRKLEHDIYQEILKDVEKKFNKEARDEVAKHLLTPIDHWVVRVDGQEDHTTKVMMRGQEPLVKSDFKLVSKEVELKLEQESKAPMMSSDRNTIKQERLATRAPPVKRQSFQNRKHYRVVFEEVAQPVWKLTNLSDIFLVLKQCTSVLKYLYACEWIHRDISAGNIYFYRGRGLLGDLEYAKRMGWGGSHDMLTGTMDFMAVEVLLRGYAFLPSPAERRGLASLIRDLKAERAQLGEAVNIPDFRHNYAHDVESVWWLALSVLFFNAIKPKTEAGRESETDDYLHDQDKYRKRIFPDRVSDITDRQMFFRNEKEFSNGLSWFPKAIADVKAPLIVMRDVLIAMYIEFEALFPQEQYEQFADLHDAFVGGFEQCRKAALHIELESLRRTKKDKTRKETPGAATARDSKSADKETAERRVQVPGTGKRKAYDLEDMPRNGKQLRLVSP